MAALAHVVVAEHGAFQSNMMYATACHPLSFVSDDIPVSIPDNSPYHEPFNRISSMDCPPVLINNNNLVYHDTILISRSLCLDPFVTTPPLPACLDRYMRKGALFIELRGAYGHGEFVLFEQLAEMFGKIRQRDFLLTLPINPLPYDDSIVSKFVLFEPLAEMFGKTRQ